jgi:hypothetical protein
MTSSGTGNYSSIVGHPGLAAYVAIAENECIARTKFEMVEVSVIRGVTSIQNFR